VRAAVGRHGGFGVFIPYAGQIVIEGGIDQAVLWDLEARRTLTPVLTYSGGRTTLAQTDVYGDVLLTGVRG
jgi:hypothetical protein